MVNKSLKLCLKRPNKKASSNRVANVNSALGEKKTTAVLNKTAK